MFRDEVRRSGTRRPLEKRPVAVWLGKLRPYGAWLPRKAVEMNSLLPVSMVESPKKKVAVTFEAKAGVWMRKWRRMRRRLKVIFIGSALV